jgi:hypothetical protein
MIDQVSTNTHHMIATSEWPDKALLLSAAERLDKDAKNLSSLSSHYDTQATDYARIADFLRYLAGRSR